MGASLMNRQRLQREHERTALADPPATAERRAFALIIAGAPIGFARMRTGNGRTFIPDRQRSRMEEIRAEWIAQGRCALPADAFYRVEIVALFERPAGHRRKDGELSAEGRRRPFPGAPDVDNIAKLLLDALGSCGAVPDDRRLVALDVRKRWVQDGERSQVWCFAEAVEA